VGATLPESAFPRLTSIGAWLRCAGATLPESAFPRLTSIGDWLDCERTTLPESAFPRLTSIGGGLHCVGATLPEHLKRVKTHDPDCPAQEVTAKKLFQSFLKAGFLFADGILSKYISKRTSGRTIIWKVQICGKTESSYVIEKDGVYSHGKTLKEAKASLIFKVTDRDTSKYESWNLDTRVSAADAIGSYRAITGACEFGVRNFCERHSIDLNKKFSPREIIQITDGEYGNQQYRRFFEQAEGKAA
jgi:hypothetical protein